MKTIKAWISSPWFKDAAERVVRAYAGAALLVLTAHGTGVIDLSFWRSVLLAGVVPAVSVIFSVLSTLKSAPSETPASLLAAPQLPALTSPGDYIAAGATPPNAGTVVVKVKADTTEFMASMRELRSTVNGSHTVTRRRITEIPVEGKPLGRHVEHDSRSLDYLVESDGTVATARWDRIIPILDQGQVGSCTGNAATGALGTLPDYATLTEAEQGALNEAFALKLYSAAETIDGDGPYPPNDNGSSGLSVAKAAKALGLISSYTHITTLAAANTAIQSGPFIVGSNWYGPGMDDPGPSGLVTATGTVRGGHEYECVGYDAVTDLWEFCNSWNTSYGIAGRFFYSSATFSKLLSEQGDATVLLPLAAPAPTPTPTPVPAGASITITDPGVVAKMTELGAKSGITPQGFVEDRLERLYKIT